MKISLIRTAVIERFRRQGSLMKFAGSFYLMEPVSFSSWKLRKID
jgi:hypothetical protein